jgi:hypothetical protein
MAKVPCSLSVFTLDSVNMICASIQATLTIENDTEEGGCINDVWETPIIVGKKWSLSTNGAVNDKNELLLKALSDPTVTVVATVAGGSWGGTALVTSATGEHARRSLDKGSASLMGVGALVWTAAV